MRHWIEVVILCVVSAVAAGAAEETFSRSVRPADFALAGLTKLSPEELVRLDALVRDFKNGAREGARSEAVAAGVQVAQAEPRAVAKEKRSEPGLLTKAKVILTPGTQVEYVAVESRIVGEFSGWEARTVFLLENGQRWRVSGGEPYVSRPEPGPAVKITPGAFGSFWMTIDGVRPRVKVVRVDPTR